MEKDEIILGGFLWAPSRKYWKEILNIINTQYKLTRVKKYKFASFEDLEKMIIKLYENDKSAPLDKIKKVKIKSLREFEPVCINFYFKVPHFDKNKSLEVIGMKKRIRNEYRDRITNYKKDIILHISDNSKQTVFINDLINYYIIKK